MSSNHRCPSFRADEVGGGESPNGGCAWDANGGRTPDVDLEAGVMREVLAVLGVEAATLAACRWKTVNEHPRLAERWMSRWR
jgi:hypothetical protein